MKVWIRLISVLMLVAMLATTFAACAKEEPNTNDGSNTSDTNDTSDTKDTSDTSDTSDKETEKLLALEDALVLTNKKKTSYAIVVDDSIDSKANVHVNSFINRFATKTGAMIETKNDTEAVKEKEILIYAMDDRNEVDSVYKKITAPNKKGFRIEVSGSKIIVACDDVMYLELALDLLYGAIQKCTEDIYGIEKNYVGMLDLPTPVTSTNSVTTVLYTSQQNYTIAVNEVSKNNYSNFVRTLTNEGFYTYSTNTINDAQFGTYVKDSIYGQEAVYTMYYPEDRCYKVTYGPLGDLPDLRAASSTKVVTPSYTQPKNTAGGLCTIVQLENGKFIVFDGGNNSNTDRPYLYNYLKDHTPNGGKPTIAAWVITHAHGDHMGLANAFLVEYADRINVEMGVYNFPDWDNVKVVWDTDQSATAVQGLKNASEAFKETLRTYYPDSKQWVVHTGEVMQFPGCELEILYTPEDYATGMGLQPNGTVSFPSGNHTNIACRLTLNGTTIIAPGDSESQLCKWMADTYGEYLKSDILTLTHHGYNGGDMDFYRYIDPDICIWPTSMENFEYHTSLFDYNRYLRNISGYNGRDRAHHLQDQETTYECTDDGPVLTVGEDAD